ncbi:MAG: N-acyl homoserine lactonase family protein [Acetobacteraceae bacterium]|nr:N-acyl homoserine lactonase family protein [Acetobacteraceae bacterium]
MKLKSLLLGSLVSASLLFGASGATRAESPQGMQLYVFSSGHLHLDKSIIQNGSSGKFDIPVAFFLIKHPKGNVLFDTGNNDRIITDPSYWGPLAQALDPGRSPDVAIDTQLAKIGVKPEDVKYVVLGHFHLDHAGNVAKFPNATLVYQRDEIRAAFWPAPGFAAPYIMGDFAPLRSAVGQDLPSRQKVIELNGDLDLFGDGSMFIHRAVSHTPGSEILVVRLPKTGTIVLTSDACYLRENLDKNLLPGIGNAFSPSGILDAYNWIRRVMDTENGDVIFAHDPDTFKAHKHAPEFYD